MGMSKRPLILMPLLVGCYNYAAIEPSAATPGIEVRARISGAASDRIAPLLGTFDTRVLTGSVVENANGQMVLEVPNGALPNTGASVVQLHSRVPLATTDLVSLETRRVDVARTSLLTGAIVAGLAAGAFAAIHARGEVTDPIGGTDGPPITRIPVLRLRF